MDSGPNKRRKLAPKIPDASQQQIQPSHNSQFPSEQPQAHTAPSNFPPPQLPQPPDGSTPAPNLVSGPAVAQSASPIALPERQGFEAFARHLQDAAMMIWRQTQKPSYTDVSVLLMRWEEDTSVEPELVALEQTFCERYNYHTERWNIPTVANPPVKLGVQMASFLENARPDHLFIIYYAGYSYVSADNQLYWACDTREDAARLKWHGVRCLFEDAQSDVLLLLDSAAVKENPTASNQYVKQAIAACVPEQNSRDQQGRSFTSLLNEALHKLSSGPPATVKRLYEDIMSLRLHDMQSRMTNGAIPPSPSEKVPICFTLTPGKGRTLTIAPLPPRSERPILQPDADVDGRSSGAAIENQLIEPSEVADLCFDEPRVLVCTTYIGSDSGPDMASFNQWIANGPPIASRISVEGMFLGPPTILIIAIPVSLWTMIQHDKVCICLGYVNSRNITPLYHRLAGSVAVNTTASAKDVEDGRILLEAREAATSSPAVHRHDHDMQRLPLFPETPSRQPTMMRTDPSLLGQLSAASLATTKDIVEDSDEMKEAAEQLKALSHIRHRSDETANMNHIPVSMAPVHLEHSPHASKREETASSHGANESGMDEMMYNNTAYSTPAARKPKRALLKQTPKQETQCNLCSHAPFKDSSSLRKHVAAAHTRPFPCAFSFAGCTSTFGSKNEWKRHIASQHLCLQYYRCSDCTSSSGDSKNNEFNRKDLFTQHLRRMHAPFSIKKNLNKDNSKVVYDWEQHVKAMQKQCLVVRRQPPQRSACPKPDCQSSFEGPGSWDEWTEHVGRHMEKGEGDRLGVDPLLAQWALEEAVIEHGGDGEYRICNANGTGGGERTVSRGESSFISQHDADTPPTLEGEDEASLLMASAKAAASAAEAVVKGEHGGDESY